MKKMCSLTINNKSVVVTSLINFYVLLLHILVIVPKKRSFPLFSTIDLFLLSITKISRTENLEVCKTSDNHSFIMNYERISFLRLTTEIPEHTVQISTYPTTLM